MKAFAVSAMVVSWLMSFSGVPAGEAAQPPADLRAMAGQAIPDQPGQVWQYAEVMVEWGFAAGAEKLRFNGLIEVTQGPGGLGAARPLAGDKHTTVVEEKLLLHEQGRGELVLLQSWFRHPDRRWRSPAGQGRRGVVLNVLFSPVLRGPGRTILTVRTSSGDFSFQPMDLRRGPMLVRDLGFFVCDLARPGAKVETPPPAREVLPPGDLLKDKLQGDAGTAGWGKGEPLIYANPSDKELRLLGGKIIVPPRGVMVHPGTDRDIVIGWRSPITGRFDLRAAVSDAHPTGGDGVTWAIAHESPAGVRTLASGAIDRAGRAVIPAQADAHKFAAVAVRKGEALTLTVGRRGEYSCDSTAIELVIVESGGGGRKWDLAADVGSDMHAGNPHADSQGNRGVWHFLGPDSAMPAGAVVRAPVPFESRATSAREFLDELARHKAKTIRQRVREHPEQTWESAVRSLHGDIEFPLMPEPPFEPAMKVDVPDKYLAGLWRLGAWRILNRCPRIHRDDLPKVLAGGDVPKDVRLVARDDPAGLYVVRDHPFPPLGCETDRILWALDHLGMHREAADGMSVWLEGQREDGALTLKSGMERAHLVGALQLPWVMAEHYWLTGDKEWLRREAPRLKRAADWILGRRQMKKELTPQERAGLAAGTFSPYGLQPKVAMGDGDPSGSRYYYWADACGYRSVRLLADALAEIDPPAGKHYADEADKYLADLLPVLRESVVLSPVMLVRDGTYRAFHPQGYQDRGPLAHALPASANIYSHCGPYHGDYLTSVNVEAWLRAGAIGLDEWWLDGHFDILEDVFLIDHPWVRKRRRDYDPDKHWFDFGWSYQSGWERLPEYYLRRDDVPNFLRAWLNRCAVDINLSNWTFNEHTTFAANDKSHGYAVFLSNFRNMLVMEIGPELHLARATPRAWLQQGRRIAVRNAPTHFGTAAFEIVSDVDNGRIVATVELPSRAVPRTTILRLRHPKAGPIKAVQVDGRDWPHFDKAKETIDLKDLSGKVRVTVSY